MSTATGATRATTVSYPFCRVTSDGVLLFEVRPGVPAIRALEMASCYLGTARDLTNDFAQRFSGDNPEIPWGAFYLIEMAMAVLNSATQALHDKERQHG